MTTRERILEAAEQVIRSRGLAHATTREIARAADCSEGSLYNHFESKETLFLCVLRERLPSFIRMVSSLPERSGQATVHDNLRELAQAALDFYRQAIPLGASALSEPDLLARQRDFLHQKGVGPHKGNELVAAYLRTEQALGRVRNDADPEAAAAAVLGACFQRAWMAVLLGMEPSDTSSETFLERLLDTLMAGLAPKE